MPLLTASELAGVYGSSYVPQARAAVGLPALIDEATFWEAEVEAPVLRRNVGLLKPPAQGGSAELVERSKRWVDMCGAAGEKPTPGGCADPAALRIFERDAERTFMTDGHRASMIGALKQFWPENKDYHQGLGYVYSFLRLTVSEDDALKLILRLNRSERHMKGYWYAAPPAYVRDAMVYARLVKEHFPEVDTLLSQAGVAAEAYVSKWFVGLCLHVLPFRALFPFYEAFLTQGSTFLFRFAMSLVQHTQAKLLACASTDASGIFAILRLDPSVVPDDDPLHDDIVAGAAKWDLTDARITELRAEEQEKLDAKMARVRAAEQQLADEESDDEIVFSDDEEDEDPEERLRRLAEAN
mmetsp:Transcript_4086/g.11625  ORF Transcript_4086/g.11625 Transcript_4086/m.11625 type:complete len:355 (+) Transcript_4086:79-1143(+)